MKTNFRYSLYTLILSVFISLIITPLRLINVPFSIPTLIGFIVYFFLTTYVFYRYGSYVHVNKLLLLILLGACCFQVPIRIVNFSSSLGSFPEFIFHILGVLTGFVFYKIKSFYRWLYLIVSLSLCLFYFFIGWNLWSNKLCYGTFSGNIIEYKVKQNLIFKNKYNQNLNISQIKGRVVLLDFWNSKCGVCYSKFPEVQKVYDKYKQNPIVNFYSVNFFLDDIDKDGDAFRIIKERGYSFPVLICRDKALLKRLNITGYPTVLIINRKGELVFRGDIEDAGKKMEELIEQNN